jgi:hypothetical protein
MPYSNQHLRGVFMNIFRLFIVLSLFITVCTASANAESENCKVDPNDIKAITKILKKESKLGKNVEVYCPDKVENYARVGYDNGVDGGSAYLIKSDGKWKLLTYGAAIDDDQLSKQRIPKAIIDKFNK